MKLREVVTGTIIAVVLLQFFVLKAAEFIDHNVVNKEAYKTHTPYFVGETRRWDSKEDLKQAELSQKLKIAPADSLTKETLWER